VATGNLGMTGLSEDERREQMQIVQAELDRLKRLFDNIVDMASVESRARSPELEWVYPAEIIEAAQRQVETALASRSVHVAAGGDQELIHLDPRLTSAALAHVLENAAAYSPEGTPIHVDARVMANELTITVRDQGRGLPPGDIDRIFERFYRAPEAPSDRFGSGMGLAITRGLLSIQGGRVTASNHPGGGAVFTLTIPVTTRSHAELALDVA
jgi:two-component system sensor histidine kinase KdpD